MRVITILIACLLCCSTVSACCGAGQERIFPLGELNEKPVCAVFKLTRDCRRGEFLYHDWFGFVTLQQWDGESFKLLDSVAEIKFLECRCKPDEILANSHYIDSLIPYYLETLKIARTMEGFYEFTPNSLLIDSKEIAESGFTVSSDIVRFKRKRLYTVTEKGLDCESMDKISEIRIYKGKSGSWAVLTITCPNDNQLPEKWTVENQNNFKHLESALTYLYVHWHTLSLEYLVRLE